MSQVIHENAWLLHSRKYTDSRILVDFLGEQGCLISGVYRVPSKTHAPQLFKPLNVSLKGNHELKQVVSVEQDYQTQNFSTNLTGTALYCGLYLNELLLRVLLRDDPHRSIYQAYTNALESLFQGKELEPVLRVFEFELLEDLGYGLDFGVDTNGEVIVDDARQHYEFIFEEGFVPASEDSSNNYRHDLLSGSVLHKLARRDFSDASTRRAAKHLSRQCIDRLLGGKVLKSRELFRAE